METVTRTGKRSKTKIDNLFWKLHFSVQHLATGKETLKARLREVFVSHLLHLLVEPSHSEVERPISECVQLATKQDDPYRTNRKLRLGKLSYTLSQSHWRTDRKIAAKIFEAYHLATEVFYKYQCEP
jgi:hypothetical protein